MKSEPFKRVQKYLNFVASLLASGTPELELPRFQVSKGKGKGRVPSRTGHKHMKYRRMMLKKRNLK